MYYINLYNTKFEPVGIIDVFKSFIRSERYQEAGNFELYMDPSSESFKLIKEDYYIDIIKNDNLDDKIRPLYIIEDYKITTDEEKGNSVSITGRDLASILDRRIIWNPTIYSGPIDKGIELLLNDNIINPKNQLRKIDNFEFIKTNDIDIKKLGMNLDVIGNSLYSVINSTCKTYNIGYKILYDFVENKYKFYLYKGKNRGEDNPEDNLIVEFSPKNDNLLSSNYVKTKSTYKNTILIGGEGENDKRYFSSLNNYNKGLQRKETYLSANIEFGDKDNRLTIAEYENQLKELGKEKLKEVEDVYAFDGKTLGYTDIDMYKINKDFFLGDIVYIENEFKKKGNSLISEIVESFDDKGYSLLPTFTSIKKEPISIQGTVHIDAENKELSITNITKPVIIIWGDGNIDRDVIGDITHIYDGDEGKYEGLYDFYIYLSDHNDIDICPTFMNSKTLYKINIPNGVQELQEKTFYDCKVLHDIILPNSLKILHGQQMFYNCENLFTIALPNSITNAEPNTFQNCSNLISANFPYNCDVAPSYYFNNCPKLSSMTFNGNSFSNTGTKIIQSNILNNCPKCLEVTFGSLVERIEGNFLNGPTKDVKIFSLNYTPPILNGSFSFNVSEIEVPNSPKFDDSILNAYKNAWPNYQNKIREKSGELPQEDVNNSENSYAKDSESYDEDEKEEIIYSGGL